MLMFQRLKFFILVTAFACTSEETKQTEASASENIRIKNTTAENNNSKTILFFGNSLTAGYGLEENEGFPELIQKRLDSLKFDYNVVNAGLSGETTTGGKNRLGWILKQKIAIFVLELGANDGLRGIPLKESKVNLQEMIDKVWEKNPETKIILMGMQIPPNMGKAYSTEFENIWPDLAKKNDISLVPFLLKNVGGIADLNQSDGIHPTAEGHKILAENVWAVLNELL
ncbi:MAG: acyl-CoA thioesterase-1 [Arcticibacterium sp.]|jgi:acyl-CoA thioesterase-1